MELYSQQKCRVESRSFLYVVMHMGWHDVVEGDPDAVTVAFTLIVPATT